MCVARRGGGGISETVGGVAAAVAVAAGEVAEGERAGWTGDWGVAVAAVYSVPCSGRG